MVSLRTGRPVVIEVVPIGEISGDTLARLASSLHERLGSPVRRGRHFAPREEWSTTAGDGWLSDAVLDSLTEWATTPANAGSDTILLALTEHPLLAPGGRPFGEATIGGCCAVVSLARLGADSDPRRFDRLVKEAIHEVAHIQGILHCSTADCVMHPSPDAASIDRKKATFCDQCAHKASRSFPAAASGPSP